MAQQIFKATLTHKDFNTSADSTIILKENKIYLKVFKAGKNLGFDVNGFSTGKMVNFSKISEAQYNYYFNKYLRFFDRETLAEILK